MLCKCIGPPPRISLPPCAWLERNLELNPCAFAFRVKFCDGKPCKEIAISTSKVSLIVSSSAQGDVCEELSDPRIVPWLSGMGGTRRAQRQKWPLDKSFGHKCLKKLYVYIMYVFVCYMDIHIHIRCKNWKRSAKELVKPYKPAIWQATLL